MRCVLLPASMFALLALATPAFAGGVANGSFERPAGAAAIPGWTARGAVALRLARHDGFDAPNGDRVVRFGARRQGGSLAQPLATTPGQAYELVFWLGSKANRHGRGHAALRVSLGAAEHAVEIDNAQRETLWQAHVVAFTASDSVTALAIASAPQRGDVPAYVDDVALRPAALALAGAARR